MSAELRSRTGAATRELIEWATRIEYDAIPSEVASRAARVIADNLAAIVAARDEPEVRCFHDYMLGAKAAPEATVFRGGRRRTERLRAAAANALAADWLELEEGYRKASCHAGLFTLPALLAEAEAGNLTVRDVLRALVLAYEVVTRVARGWQVNDLAIHGHARFAAIGAAAATALARRLPPAQALGAVTAGATFLNAGPHEHGIEGALVRNAWPAAGALNGMLSATWAACGVTGLPEGLYDVFSHVLGGQAFPERLTAELSSSWAVLDGYSKIHACCQYAHSTVEALLEARGKGIDAEEVEEIAVATHRLALPMANIAPPTTLAGKFSLPHIAATTLVHGNADVAAFAQPSLTDPAVARLRNKVKLLPFGETLPPPHDRPARVVITLKDGRKLEATCLSAAGGPDRPHPESVVIDKIRRLTHDVYPRFLPVMERVIALDPTALDRPWEALVSEFTNN